MYIAFHGGGCCGIKIIRELGSSPDLNVFFCGTEPDEGYYDEDDFEEGFQKYDPTADGDSFCSTDYWGPSFTGTVKASTQFEKCLDFIKKNQPGCLVEVVISNHYQLEWRPYLEALGFKKTAEWKNSNSNAILTQYHLVIQGGKEQK